MFIKKYYQNDAKIFNLFGLKIKTRNPKFYHDEIIKKFNELILYQRYNNLLDENKVFTFYYENEVIRMYIPKSNDDAVQTPILQFGTFFEIQNLEKIRKYINCGSFVLDAGANIGNHTVYFSKICGAKKVYAYEPLKPVYDMLCKNVELNNINNVECHNIALGERSGRASIEEFHSSNLGGTSFKEDTNGKFVLTSLDEQSFENLDFCKIDVEGHQLKLLKGAEKTLAKFKPALWIEMLSTENFGKNDLEELIKPKKLLEEYGYVLKEQLTNIDYIYIHKDNL